MKEFNAKIKECIRKIEDAASLLEKPEVDEYFAECGYDMDLERELIVLQYLEEYFKD